MKALLDTHTLLWWMTDDSRLSSNARAVIGQRRNGILVSAASAWEIATKHRLGKLPNAISVVDQYFDLVRADGFGHLPVLPSHALKAGSLDCPHRDPFDRMLAAQSKLDNLPLVTRDPVFRTMDIAVIW